MADVSKELFDMKEWIENAKQDAARIEGQIKQLEKQRLDELGCSTDEETEQYIKERTEKVSELNKELEDGLATIKEELGWG